MKIEVHLLSQSQPITYEGVREEYDELVKFINYTQWVK